MKFWGIFRNNVLGILKIGIFPDCSMNILRMLHAIILGGSRNTIAVFSSGLGCFCYSLSVYGILIFSWKFSKYATIANNCLTTNYKSNYKIP